MTHLSLTTFSWMFSYILLLILMENLIAIISSKFLTEILLCITRNVEKHPKELMIIPGANHVDLYDSPTAIPFEKLKSFLRNILNSVYTRSGQNSTPNSNATNLHSSQKRCCSFCISSSNASPTFQVQKSIFHQMTKPIQVTVILPLLLAISFSRNDDIHSSISGISNDLIGVIPTIGQ